MLCMSIILIVLCIIGVFIASIFIMSKNAVEFFDSKVDEVAKNDGIVAALFTAIILGVLLSPYIAFYSLVKPN